MNYLMLEYEIFAEEISKVFETSLACDADRKVSFFKCLHTTYDYNFNFHRGCQIISKK